MTKRRDLRAERVFKQLAGCGKYVSTGKVLIGLTYQRKPPPLTENEELLQSMLLGIRRPFIARWLMPYIALLMICASLFVSCRS
jgi:hypothetical protein